MLRTKIVFISMMTLVSFGCPRTNLVNSAPTLTSAETAANITKKIEDDRSKSIEGPQRITIESPDKTIIVGSYYESSKPNSPALLLLHQWQSDRHSYDDFAKRMQAKGFNVLAIDGRGFGESVKTADGKVVQPERTDPPVEAMLEDVGAAFDFLAKQKNVDPLRIAIVGASYGSSLALIYAAENPKVAATVLISPGVNYFGNMQTEPAIRKYGDRPMFLVAAEDDKESADAVNKLMSVGNNVRYGGKIFPSGGHGTALFKYRDTFNGPPVLAEMLEWFLADRLGKSEENK